MKNDKQIADLTHEVRGIRKHSDALIYDLWQLRHDHTKLLERVMALEDTRKANEVRRSLDNATFKTLFERMKTVEEKVESIIIVLAPETRAKIVLPNALKTYIEDRDGNEIDWEHLDAWMKEQEATNRKPDGRLAVLEDYIEDLHDAKKTEDGVNCIWRENHDGAWETSCKNCFEFTTDGPTENGICFCPYCGKAPVEVPYVLEGADYE